jgi:hypothetical protein
MDFTRIETADTAKLQRQRQSTANVTVKRARLANFFCVRPGSLCLQEPSFFIFKYTDLVY